MKFDTGARVVTNTFLVTTYGDHDEIDAMPGVAGTVVRYENDQICHVLLDGGAVCIAHESELDHIQ